MFLIPCPQCSTSHTFKKLTLLSSRQMRHKKKDILERNLRQEATAEELEWLDKLRFLIAIELLLNCYLNSRALE